MQIKGNAAIENFIKSPPSTCEGALIYGRDPGLVRERSRFLERAVLGPDPAPFNLIEMTESDLKEGPGALYAETAALTMLGGRKFIRVRISSEVAGKALKAYLAERESGAPAGDAFFVIEAGELRAGQAMRKQAEGASLIATIACYPDDAASLEALIEQMAKSAGLRIGPPAKAALMERLGNDRGISRQEIEKLLLYIGPGQPDGPKEITTEDVVAIVGDSGAAELDKLIDAVFIGDLKTTALLCGRLRHAGTQPVRILRMVAMHVERLKAANSKGHGAPLNYFQAKAVERHTSRWSLKLLARADSLVLETEIQCKTTGLPAAEACERMLFALARGAQSARR